MIKQQAKQMIKSGQFSSLSAKRWQLEASPITTSGKSLAALYSLAQARKLKGKSFFGFGNWRNYLISLVPEVAKVMPAYKPIIRGNTVSREQIDATFREAIKQGLSLRPVDWRESPTTRNSKVKPDYAALSRARKTLNSRKYLGHGSYPAYLQQVHGVTVPKKYVRRK